MTDVVKQRVDQDITLLIHKVEDPRTLELLKAINDNLIILSEKLTSTNTGISGKSYPDPR